MIKALACGVVLASGLAAGYGIHAQDCDLAHKSSALTSVQVEAPAPPEAPQLPQKLVSEDCTCDPCLCENCQCGPLRSVLSGGPVRKVARGVVVLPIRAAGKAVRVAARVAALPVRAVVKVAKFRPIRRAVRAVRMHQPIRSRLFLRRARFCP